MWGTQTTTGVQLDASHELFNIQQGTRTGGEGVLVNEELPPQPRVNVPARIVGSWGIPSFHVHLHLISCCAIPGV